MYEGMFLRKIKTMTLNRKYLFIIALIIWIFLLFLHFVLFGSNVVMPRKGCDFQGVLQTINDLVSVPYVLHVKTV